MALNLSRYNTYIQVVSIYENKDNFYFIGKNTIKEQYNIFSIKRIVFNKNNIEQNSKIKLSELLVEDTKTYNKNEISKKLEMLKKVKNDKLNKIEKCYGIIGFVKFLLGYYVMLISETSKIGKITKYVINRVDSIRMLPLFYSSEIQKEKTFEYENRYLEVFKGIDFSKQLYFSYTYNITKTLQRNFVENFKKEILVNYDKNFYMDYDKQDRIIKKFKIKVNTTNNTNNNTNNNNTNQDNIIIENIGEEEEINTKKDKKKDDNNNSSINNNSSNSNSCSSNSYLEPMYDLKKFTNHWFLWNYHHIEEFFYCIKNKLWCIYCIYGYFEQIQTDIYGLRFLVSVISRRNRYFAGTRYLKRGINNDGNVANDVETEQILEEISTSCSDQPNISSFVHIRASVPIYWFQEQKSILPKPDIQLNLTDIKFEATRRHFHLLTQRYGTPCLVCNLTKSKEKKMQETGLNFWYKTSIEYINNNDQLSDANKIIYNHYDIKKLRKLPKFYKTYCDESLKLVAKTNMFCFIPFLNESNSYMVSLQNGVIRSNCVDCLDRTNVFQQLIATSLMMLQLRILGIEAVEPESEYEEIYGILTEIYKNMGNILSFQYAGSLAHKQTIKDTRSKMDKLINKVPEMYNTFKRYFTNTFNDHDKQMAINLFLGKYKFDNKYQPHLWDVVSDVDLHKKKHLKPLDKKWAEEGMEYYTKYNLLCDIVDKFNSFGSLVSKKELMKFGKTFTLDLANKIKISKFYKPIEVLISDEYRDIMLSPTKYQESPLYDYLIGFNKYVEYKRAHPLKYLDQILYQRESPIFFNLDIDKKNQIKTFEKFSYSPEENENVPNEQGMYNKNNIDDTRKKSFIDESEKVLVLYDDTVKKTIAQMFLGRKDRKNLQEKKSQKISEDILHNIDEDFNDDKTKFNICSFEIEEGLFSDVNEHCNPELRKEKFAEYKYKPENASEFSEFLPLVDTNSELNDPSNYQEDLLKKMNILDIDLKFFCYDPYGNGIDRQQSFFGLSKNEMRKNKENKDKIEVDNKEHNNLDEMDIRDDMSKKDDDDDRRSVNNEGRRTIYRLRSTTKSDYLNEGKSKNEEILQQIGIPVKIISDHFQ